MASLSDLDPVRHAATYVDHESPGRRPPARRGPPEIDLERLALRVLDSARRAARGKAAPKPPYLHHCATAANW